jgi:hypothetical protein
LRSLAAGLTGVNSQENQTFLGAKKEGEISLPSLNGFDPSEYSLDEGSKKLSDLKLGSEQGKDPFAEILNGLPSIFKGLTGGGGGGKVGGDLISMISGGIGSLFGVKGGFGGILKGIFGFSEGSLPMPSYGAGTMPVPSYSGGTMRVDTPVQDTRERDGRSQFAVINSNELVVPAASAQKFVNFERDRELNQQRESVKNSYSTTNSPVHNSSQTTNITYQEDTFKRSEGSRMVLGGRDEDLRSRFRK